MSIFPLISVNVALNAIPIASYCTINYSYFALQDKESAIKVLIIGMCSYTSYMWRHNRQNFSIVFVGHRYHWIVYNLMVSPTTTSTAILNCKNCSSAAAGGSLYIFLEHVLAKKYTRSWVAFLCCFRNVQGVRF